MLRRFARVYPLHLVTLLAGLLFRLLRIGLVTAGVVIAAPAAFEVNNFYSFVLNIFLLHSMGSIDYLSWNAPSWSISVEFYTYLVFGLVMLLAQRMRFVELSICTCRAPGASEAWFFIIFVLDKPSLGLQTDFGILRCFVSFFLGVLTVMIVERMRPGMHPTVQGGIQLVTMIASIVLVSIVEAYPPASFLAPLCLRPFSAACWHFRMRRLFPGCWWLGRWCGWGVEILFHLHGACDIVLFAEYFVRALGPAPDCSA